VITITHLLYMFTAVLPAPTNVQVRRISSTAMEVTWDPPIFPGIAGYRVYYNVYTMPDLEKWNSVETGPYMVTEINGLEPQTAYAVQVKAKSLDGRLGNSSEIVYTNKLENGKCFLVSLVQIFLTVTCWLCCI